jgi:hypothetical protein
MTPRPGREGWALAVYQPEAADEGLWHHLERDLLTEQACLLSWETSGRTYLSDALDAVVVAAKGNERRLHAPLFFLCRAQRHTLYRAAPP